MKKHILITVTWQKWQFSKTEHCRRPPFWKALYRRISVTPGCDQVKING